MISHNGSIAQGSPQSLRRVSQSPNFHINLIIMTMHNNALKVQYQQKYNSNQMGNSNQDKNVRAAIFHDIQNRPDGDWLVGTAYIQTLKPIEQGTVNIRITGKQECSWTETTHDGERTHTITYVGQKQIYRFEQVLADFGTNINTGMYEIKFQWKVPPNLPPTFLFQSDASASVTYKIQTVFRHPRNPKVLQYPQDLTLNMKSRPAPPKPFIKDLHETATCCGCNKGTINGQLFLDKTTYEVGNTALMTIRLQHLQRNISSIKVKLLKVATLTGTGGLIPFTKTRQFYEEMQSFKLPGVNMIGFKEDQLLRIEMGSSGGKIVSPTYEGYCVRINYQLYVEFDMEGCCNGSAEIYVPTLLLNQKYVPVANPFVFDLPPGWSPQVMPMVNFGYQPYQPYAIPPQQTSYNRLA